MKNDFNLETLYGKLGSAVANGSYHDGIKVPLKELLKFPGNAEVEIVIEDTLDFAASKIGAQNTLSLVYELLQTPPSPALTEKMRAKWDVALAAVTRQSGESALMYLTNYGHIMEADHPLLPLTIARWAELVDARMPLNSFETKTAFSLENVKNAAFRSAMLGKLASFKDAEPEMVLTVMLAAVDGPIYSFKDSDPVSAKIIFTTLADILDAHKGEYDLKKTADIAWKVFSHGQGTDESSERLAARIYLDTASKTSDVTAAFNMYQGLVQRRNPHIAAESRDAAFEMLDMVDAGKFDSGKAHDVASAVSEKIFHPAIAPETRDADLAARASDTLLNLVRVELSKPEAGSSYLHFNSAIQLLKYFSADDPRAPEVVALWKTALTNNFKTRGQDYFVRQMGWMLDVATERGDVALADYARTEWTQAIGGIATKNPKDAHKMVKEIVTNAAHYSPNSPLVKEAQALLPEIEKRAGVVHMPETLSRADYQKLLQEKRAPKP